MKRYIERFALAGFVVPLMFMAVWELYFKYTPRHHKLASVIEVIQLLLYPSSLFMLATADLRGLEVLGTLAVSITVNMVYYTFVGFFIWFGVERQRWVIYLLLGLILWGWHTLINM